MIHRLSPLQRRMALGLVLLLLSVLALYSWSTLAARRRGLTGKAEWRRLEQAYERFRKEGKLPATYEVIYGHAWKGEAPPKLPDGSQVVNFRERP